MIENTESQRSAFMLTSLPLSVPLNHDNMPSASWFAKKGRKVRANWRSLNPIKMNHISMPDVSGTPSDKRHCKTPLFAKKCLELLKKRSQAGLKMCGKGERIIFYPMCWQSNPWKLNNWKHCNVTQLGKHEAIERHHLHFMQWKTLTMGWHGSVLLVTAQEDFLFMTPRRRHTTAKEKTDVIHSASHLTTPSQERLKKVSHHLQQEGCGSTLQIFRSGG